MKPGISYRKIYSGRRSITALVETAITSFVELRKFRDTSCNVSPDKGTGIIQHKGIGGGEVGVDEI